MWGFILRVTDIAVDRRFDLLDVLFFAVGATVMSTQICQGVPAFTILMTAWSISTIYIAIAVLVFYIRRICFGRITNTDPFYGGSE